MISHNRDLLEGKRISQRFRINTVEQWQEHAVFCTADDLEKNRQVSLILIDALAIKSPDSFEKTAKRKQKLKHANLVSLEAWGQTNEGEPFLALDLVGLDELDTTFDPKKASGSGSPNGARASVEIISQIIDGISFLADNHEPCFLPLPNRVRVSPGQPISVKILDLNYSESLAENDLLVRKPLNALETASYTAPECIKEKEPDARSQIYSLGCLLYQLLTGVLPFASDDLVELQSQQLCVAPRRFHEARPDLYLLPSLEACVMKALSKDPAQRQSSLRQLQIDLKDAIRQKPWWQKKWRQVACFSLACAASLYASGYVVQPFWAVGQTDKPDPISTPANPDVSLPQPGNDALSSLPAIPENAIKLGHLNLSGSNQKTLDAGNYQCDDILLSGSAKLICNGDVKLWIKPDSDKNTALAISGQAELSASKEADKLKIYYLSASTIVLTGEAKLKATVLAPASLLDASGNSIIDGTFTSAGQKLSDKAHFVGGPSLD